MKTPSYASRSAPTETLPEVLARFKQTTATSPGTMKELKSSLAAAEKVLAEAEANLREVTRPANDRVTAARGAVNDAKAAIRAAYVATVLAHVDALLALVPDHNERAACNDDDRDYNDKCARCILLEAKKSGYLSAHLAVRVTIEGD